MNIINKMKSWLGLASIASQPRFIRNTGELEVGYMTDKPSIPTKKPMTVKQIGLRNRSKRAKQARKLNRRIH